MQYVVCFSWRVVRRTHYVGAFTSRVVYVNVQRAAPRHAFLRVWRSGGGTEAAGGVGRVALAGAVDTP